MARGNPATLAPSVANQQPVMPRVFDYDFFSAFHVKLAGGIILQDHSSSPSFPSESSSMGTQLSRASIALHHIQPGKSWSSCPTFTRSPAATLIGFEY